MLFEKIGGKVQVGLEEYVESCFQISLVGVQLGQGGGE